MDHAIALHSESSHLSCVDELKRSESSLQVGSVGLEIVESASNAGLELRWVLAGGRVGGDLVEGGHDCGCCCREDRSRFQKFTMSFSQFLCVSLKWSALVVLPLTRKWIYHVTDKKSPST